MEHRFIALAPNGIDITGKRFGRLIALGPIGQSSRREYVWLCQCDCGRVVDINGTKLRSGGTKSCGCLTTDRLVRQNTKHGLSRSRVYRIRKGILERCSNPNCHNYNLYRGRGITICEEWKHDARAFYDYVSRLPNFDIDGLSLDRINNDGNYEPGNLRWATATMQQRNTQSNRMITFEGRTQCVAAWADEAHMTRDLLRSRLKAGWDIKRALTTPARRQTPAKPSTHKGVRWHKITGKWEASITINHKRLYLGLFASEDDAAQACLIARQATERELGVKLRKFFR